MPTWARTMVSAAVLSIVMTGCGREPWYVNPDVTWIETYGGNRNDIASDVLLSSDGSLFIVGHTRQPAETGRGADIYVIRKGASGALEWIRTFGGEGDDRGEAITWGDDSTLVIAGTTSPNHETGVDAYLLGIDVDGNKLWSRVFGGPLDEWASVVQPTSDGGFFLAGNIVDPNDFISNSGAAGYGGFDGRSSLFVIRTDSEGGELWSRAYDTADNALSWSGLATPDGGYLALATVTHFPDGNDDLLLLKVDGNGDQMWSRTWDEGRTSAYEIIDTPDGNYLITGFYWPNEEADRSKQDYIFIKVDPGGRQIWSHTFGDPDMRDYGAVVTKADGGFVAAGTWARDLMSREEDVSLIKIDQNGDVLWKQVFEAGTHNMFGGIVALPNGKYAIAGSTIVRGQFDVFLIYADSAGNPTH